MKTNVLRMSAAGLLAGSLLIGAYQNRNLNLASNDYLNRLFASLTDDDNTIQSMPWVA